MFETVNKLMLAGLGALSMTRDRAEKIFDEYVKRGHAESGDRTKFIKDMMDSADRVRKDLEETIHRQAQQAVAKLDLATREDLARVEEKIDALLKRCP